MATAFTLQHGDKVRYIGRTDRELGLNNGEEYHCCGMYPQPPMAGWRDRDEIAVYVPDPRDNFGGVVARPASQFEKL